MLTAIRRPVLLLAATALLLAGCGTGPSQPNTAVIIGDRTISVGEVQHRLDEVLRSEPSARELAKQHKLDLVARELVAQLAMHDLLAEAARREGLAVDREVLASRIAQHEVVEIPTDGSVPPNALARELANRARDVSEVKTDEVLAAQLAIKYLGRVTVTFNVAQVERSEQARELAKRIAEQPDKSNELMTAAAGQPAQSKVDQRLGANSLDALFLAVPANSVLVLSAGQSEQGGGYQVVHVKSWDVAASPPADFDPSGVEPGDLQQIGHYLVRPLALQLDVRVSPRYGSWDPVLLQVVPAQEASVGSQLLVARSAGS